MKKRLLPFSLLLVIMILGQAAMADGGHYVPRAKETTSAESFLSSMRVNQHTGLIDPAWMIAASKQTASAKDNASDALYWITMGPDNIGGKTTAIVYNNQNPSEVFIGSMGGGVFHTVNQGISWNRVGDNLMVSCMAQAEDGTIYVGTGDGNGAQNNNGMSDLDYENSFIGTGLYTIKNNVMELVEGTAPSLNAAGEWSFINDVAVDGNTVIVATCDGIRYLQDGAWQYAKVDGADLTGSAIKVMATADHKIVASVDGSVYIGTLGNMVCRSSGTTSEVLDSLGVITQIASAPTDGLVDVTVAPSDNNVIYAATINTSGSHEKIYSSYDQGATWAVILPATPEHNVYEEKGLYNHSLVVDPSNPYRVYVLAKNIWRLERYSTTTIGYYLAQKMSNASVIHGINDLQFAPSDTTARTGYVASDGGIYKLNVTASGTLSFENCNRGYVSTRCFNVAPTATDKRLVAGILDHGPVYLQGLENTNTLGTCELLLPELSSPNSAYYSESYLSGSGAVSVIRPEVIFLTTQDGKFRRSETEFVDYDNNNFAGTDDDPKFSFSGFRMPIALWESFNNEYNIEEVWFKCTKNQNAGDTVQCFSRNGGYPFDYILPHGMTYNPTNPDLSDSLLVPDHVTAKMYVASASGSKHNIYVTFDALQFNKVASWYQLGTVNGYTTCFEISADGDVLFIGTKNGSLYRISNLHAVVDENTASYTSDGFAAQVTEITLPIEGQCVTSVSVFNEDNNKVVVTLGNYGNDCYVLYSDNALDPEPVFVSKQGDLKKMPVYSSIYTVYTYQNENGNEVKAEHVVLGTEHGIYRTEDITAASPVWVSDSYLLGDVPVLDLKQQRVSQADQQVTDADGVVTVFPGVHNQGVIYAATFGRGLFRCENYRVQYSGEGVSEHPVAAAESKVSMYPNPVRDAATVSFELNGNASVSYQVYDLNGRVVKMENMGNYGQGKHEINVSVEGLAKGAYVLRLNAGSQTSNVKFMVF